MTGLVSQQPQPPQAAAAVDVAHHAALELAQARVCDEERNRDARNAIRREPLFGQPHVRLEVDAAPAEFVVEREHVRLHQTAVHAQPQVAQAQLQ